MTGREKMVKEILLFPDEIKRSKIDNSVFLYYGTRESKLYCVVAKHEANHGFIITTYQTDKAKEDVTVWKK